MDSAGDMEIRTFRATDKQWEVITQSARILGISTDELIRRATMSYLPNIIGDHQKLASAEY